MIKADIKTYDIIIIGGGPAGLAAAVKCHELGIKDILLIERDFYPGGILPQCIHGGFGLKTFKKELTGPEYSQVFIDKVKAAGVKVMLNTMALSINAEGLTNKPGSIIKIKAAGRDTGFIDLNARALILALGCREKTRGQIMIPGSRPVGVFTAGLVQRMVNIEGYLPGKEAVILGSGDIGLIMARRLTLEGCNVKGVFELMPFSTGLLRNISQCLEDYNIPLYLSHTVTKIIGAKRIEAVEVCGVDSNLKPVFSSAKTIKCDTLLLSVGLIPENELSKTCGIIIDKNTGGPAVDEDFQTSVPGIFSCGNSLFVYDIVDSVTEDAYKAAENAALYLSEMDQYKKPAEPDKDTEFSKSDIKLFNGSLQRNLVDIYPGENIAYAVPQKITAKKDVYFKIRAKVPLKNATIEFAGTTFRKNFKYINPGEMIFIKVPKQALKDAAVLSDTEKVDALSGYIKVNLNGDCVV
jgi:NADPH-dependent 2,4-dienoyl-CoA reductase/sulfur reductase-like enzyme